MNNVLGQNGTTANTDNFLDELRKNDSFGKSVDSLTPWGEEHPFRVLIADDCPDMQILLTHLFEKMGATVTVADDGEECVELCMYNLARKRPFDMILVDAQMPNLDGYEASRRLRQAGYLKPIVMITAHPGLAEKKASAYNGCDAFLAKSSLRENLLLTLKSLGCQVEWS